MTNYEEILESEMQKAKSAERRKQMTIRRWFKQPQLYQVTPSVSRHLHVGTSYLSTVLQSTKKHKCLKKTLEI